MNKTNHLCISSKAASNDILLRKFSEILITHKETRARTLGYKAGEMMV